MLDHTLATPLSNRFVRQRRKSTVPPPAGATQSTAISITRPKPWLIELDALQELIARLVQWSAFGGTLSRHPPPQYSLQANKLRIPPMDHRMAELLESYSISKCFCISASSRNPILYRKRFLMANALYVKEGVESWRGEDD